MLDFYVKKKINSAFKNNKRIHISHSLEDAKKILILFNYKDWEQINIIEKELLNMGKVVLLWTHQLDSESNSLPRKRDIKVISPKEVSSLKGLNQNVVKEFEDLKYDTLIDLSTSPDNVLLYLLSINQAEFCIGYKKYEENVFDLCVLVNESSTLMETYEQIKFYWNNIR